MYISYTMFQIFVYNQFDILFLTVVMITSVGGVAGSSPHYYNTAWSTTLSRGNRRILTQEADLVTAHGQWDLE